MHDKFYSHAFTSFQWLLTSIMRTTEFTREYSVITRKYKSAQQELLASIFNSSAITREQCTSHVARAKHSSYLQNFSRHKSLLAFFVNLDVSCTVTLYSHYFFQYTDTLDGAESALYTWNSTRYSRIIESSSLARDYFTQYSRVL